MADPQADRGSGIELERVTDPLELLFVRCHRDELQPLAQLLGVEAADGGLGTLARNLGRVARRLARHDVVNAFLGRGEGPAWVTVLATLSGESHVGFDEIPEVEVRIVSKATARHWAGFADAERRDLWRSLGLDGEPPAVGEAAMAEAQSRLGRGFGYSLTQSPQRWLNRAKMPWLLALAISPIGCLLRPCLAIAALLWFFWSTRADRDRLTLVVMHVARLRQIVLRRITVGLVGSPSTGKDAAIRALFGIDSGNISPVAGSTKTVNIQRVPGATALYVVNTPGLGDVVQSVTDEAKQVLAHIDVYLYVVNAEGGVQARELADYRACRASGKPVLALVNKIDLLRPADKERYLADARAKLSAPEADFLPVAFDPMPELAPGPIGLAEVRSWLVRVLDGLGKDTSELPELPGPAAPPAPPLPTP